MKCEQIHQNPRHYNLCCPVLIGRSSLPHNDPRKSRDSTRVRNLQSADRHFSGTKLHVNLIWNRQCPEDLSTLNTVNSRLADASLVRTPRYCGQELKSREIRITADNSRYYGHQLVIPMMSVIKRVDSTKQLAFALSLLYYAVWLVNS